MFGNRQRMWKRPANCTSKWKRLSREMEIYRKFSLSLTIFATNWHLIPIFSPPHNVRFGKTLGFTHQRHICAFSHNHIIASHRFDDNRRNCGRNVVLSDNEINLQHLLALTYDLEVTFSGSHGIGVHLTHVPASIRLLHLPDVQIPATVIIVCQYDAWVLSDDIVVDAENRLSINAHPRDLHQEEPSLQRQITSQQNCVLI